MTMTALKPDAWKVLEEALEIGLKRGLHRMFKHDDHPRTLEELLEGPDFDYLWEAVRDEIADWFPSEDR